MNRFKLFICISLSLMYLITNAQFSGGAGTSVSPYQIANKNDLNTLSANNTYWSSYFIQTANINLAAADFASGGLFYNAGLGFSPIGNATANFTGNYNGNGKTIDGLYINRPLQDSIGLFGSISTIGNVHDLGLSNADITGDIAVGILAGRSDGIISKCFSTGTVTGDDGVGGLIGVSDNSAANTSQCFSSADVIGGAGNVGGLIGVAASYARISNCYALGDVSGYEATGGFIGGSNYAYVSYCYSAGSVTGSPAGGPNVGGFVGLFYGTTTHYLYNFWNTQTAGVSVGKGGGHSFSFNSLFGITTSQMQTQSTFTTYYWDFVGETTNGSNDYWKMPECTFINGGYPQFNYYTPPPTNLVINTNDSGCGSLRWVVSKANDGDVIHFDPTLISGGSATITLLSEIFSNKGLTFKGLYNATDTLFISGGGTSNIFRFNVNSAVQKFVEFDSITLTNSTNDAILIQGGDSVNLINSSIYNCNNGIQWSAFNSNSRINVQNSSINNNSGTAILTGGNDFVSIKVNYSTINNNNAAITASGRRNVDINVSKSTITNNTGNGVSAYAYLGSSTASFTNVNILNSTITNNNLGVGSAVGGGPGTPNLNIQSSIIAFNNTNAVRVKGAGSLTFSSDGFNIFSNSPLSNNSNDQFNVTIPMLNLQPLAYNGGRNKTLLPGPFSVAIDRGNPTNLSDAQNDIIQHGRRDVGAAENCNKYTVESAEACNIYTWLDGNTYIEDTLGSLYAYAGVLSNGCDSVVELDLKVYKTAYDTTNAFLCSGGSYPWRGNNYSMNGTYMDTVQFTNFACDSVVYVLNLTSTSGTHILPYSLHAAGGGGTTQSITFNMLSSCQDSVGILVGADIYNGTIWYNGDFDLYIDGSFIDNYPSGSFLDLSSYIPISTIELRHYASTWHNIFSTVYVESPNCAPIKPIVSDTIIKYCLNDVASPLNASITGSGTSLRWFTSENGDGYTTATPTPNTSIAGTYNYYVSQVDANGCEGERVKIEVQVSEMASDSLKYVLGSFANGGNTANVNFDMLSTCQDSVKIFGGGDYFEGINWNSGTFKLYVNGSLIGNYSSGTELDLSSYIPINSIELTHDNSNYHNVYGYVTVYRSECAAPALPLADTIVNYCLNEMAIPVSATLTESGTQLRWFTSAEGHGYTTTAPTPSTATVDTINYWVSQINAAGCESGRVKINVYVNPAPVIHCMDTTIYLDASGTDVILLASFVDSTERNACFDTSYLDKQYTFGCLEAGIDTVVKLYLLNGLGELDSCTATVSIRDTLAPVVMCQNYTAILDSLGNVRIDTGDINNGTSDNCAIDTMYLSAYNFSCMQAGVDTMVTLYAVDKSGNIDSCTAIVSIQDNSSPKAICQNINVYLDELGQVTINANQIDNGSNDNCSIDTLTLTNYNFTCAELGVNTVALTAFDNSGNSAACTSFVTVLDTVAPIAKCKPHSTQLSTSGIAIITTADIDNGSTDACGIDSMYLSMDTFTCANYGLNNITLYVMDASGNIDSCSTYVDIQDNTVPEAVCHDTTLYLDATGMASITAADVNGGSWDSCGISSLTIDKTNFTCTDLGTNTVTLSVNDDKGNTGMCTATVTVLDTLAPMVMCQTATVQLDVFGQAHVSISDIDNGTTDNCGAPTLSISQSNFTCANLGANNVTLYATDASGNTDSCVAVVTVEDNLNPLVVCKNISIQLSATGTASITPVNVINSMSDNCGIDTAYLDIYDFTCADLGANDVLVTVEDSAGNTATCTATVTVLGDSTAPMVSCNNTTVYLDATGQASVSNADLVASASAVCGIADTTLSQYTFTCADLGATSVSVNVSDVNGLSSSCIATVTVMDTLAPMVMCQNVTIQLDLFGQAHVSISDLDNGTTDNCGAPTLSISQSNFTCANLGANNVTLYATDASGNTDSCVAVVTVEDNLNPLVVCKNINIQLSAAGSASITPTDVINSMSDNCGIDTAYLDIYDFTCADLGANDVLVTVEDSAGNMASCTATITVMGDSTAPMVSCNNTTVYLDATGQASVSNADLVASASAICGITDTTLSQYTFTCADLGSTSVMVSVSDVNGLSSSCIATVTVMDTLAPMVMCQTATVQLDVFGQAHVSISDIDNGTTDNCGAPTLSISQSNFTCANLGANNVTLYATDASGNTDSCVAVVTVEDNLNPLVVCKNINIQLSATGTASITPVNVINSMSDNCGIDTAYLDIYDFTCADLGANDVLVTVEDSAGNMASCTATITVMGDSTAPMVSCNNTTVYLDATGQASVSNADLVASASAVCGIADTTLSQYTFTCADLGTTSVAVSVSDVNGLSSSCTALVTVMDTFTTTLLPYTDACSGAAITISVQTGRAGALATWYSDAAGTNILGTGNPFTTAPLTSSTSIWVNETFGNGCSSALIEVPINVVSGSQANVSSNSPVCYGDNIELTADGGFVIYNWYGPNGFTSNDQNPTVSDASLMESGDYYLVVQSLNGCISDSAMTSVVINPEVVLSTALDAQYTFCEDGLVLVTATLDANQSATWSGPNGFTSANETIDIATANEAQHEGVYTLVVTDNTTGCSSTAEYVTFLDIVPRPVLNSITGGNTTVCPGESFTLETSNVNGAVYTWTLPDGSNASDNPLTISAADTSNAGTYTVFAAQGSCVSDTLSTTVGLYPQPDINIEAINDTFVQGDVIRLLATGGVSYLWSPYDYVNNPNSAEIFISDAPYGDFTYQVTGFDLNACLDSASFNFTILPNTVLEVNDVITPNGDGKNDVWVVDFLENLDEYTIRILSRNGAEVYKATKPYNNDWNGISDEGKELPSGAYFYIIETPVKVYTGGLTIVK